MLASTLSERLSLNVSLAASTIEQLNLFRSHDGDCERGAAAPVNDDEYLRFKMFAIVIVVVVVVVFFAGVELASGVMVVVDACECTL